MTEFSAIDEAIRRWSRDRNLPLYSQYREDEVRTFLLSGQTGKRAQIWIEVEGSRILVNAWDHAKRMRIFKTNSSGIQAALDRALKCAEAWVDDKP